MKKILFIPILSALLFTMASCPGSGGDDQVFPTGSNAGALTPRVCVAWEEPDGSGISQIHVKCREVPGSWTSLGSSLNVNQADNAHSPSMAIDTNGTPFVAWDENGTIHVKYWNKNAQSWDPIPDVVTGTVSKASISIGQDNAIAVAYLDGSSGFDLIYVHKWTGGGWAQVGIGYLNVSASVNAASVSMCVHSSDIMFVAWQEPPNVYVKGWTNLGFWARMPDGGSANIGANDYSPVMRLDGSGVPYIILKDSGNVYTRYWDFTQGAWVTLGGAKVNNAASAMQPAFAIDKLGNPYVMWDESYLYYVKRWDGATWQALGAGSISDTSGAIFNGPSFAVTGPVDPGVDSGMPFAFLNENVGSLNFNLYSKYWDGSVWSSAEILDIDQTKAARGPSSAAK